MNADGCPLSKHGFHRPLAMPLPARHAAFPDPPTGMGIGFAVSLSVHLALLLALQQRVPAPAAPTEGKRAAIAVFLAPPEPAAPAATANPEAKAPSPAPHRPRMKSRPPATIQPAIPPPPAFAGSSPPADGPGVEPPPPSIDIEAARASVPEILKQLDREKTERPVDQVAANPLYGESEATPLGRKIAQAGRPDCLKNGAPGGLLAPVFMLMEKKGTGCKW